MKIFKVLIIIFLTITVLYILRDGIKLTKSPSPTTQKTQISSADKDYEFVVTDLDIPWDMVFLPNGDMLVTERAGNVLRIGKETKTVSKISGVNHIGEGGLLGLVMDPDFKNNNFIYFYLTYSQDEKIMNRVERYQFESDVLKNRYIVLDEIKGSSNHDGGRIAFGPDGYLYIATGDAEIPNLAQNKNSLNGKILRISPDGSIPSDNPFKNAVWSYGHRNVQGIAWDRDGNMWATEHGPSGIQSGNDEINLIIKGGNYGWPIIKGDKRKDEMISPVLESGSKSTWAPSGMVILENNIFFAGLRGEALYQAKIINNDNLQLKAHFKNQFGRIRTVVVGPDNNLYILTNNKDGRGKPRAGDDKIIRVSAKRLLSQ